MVKLLFLKGLAKLLGPIGLGAGAFYFGTQNAHVVEKAEHNLLRSHMEYAADTHRGSLGIEEIENNNGELEKTLKNLDTGDTIYSIKADCLPDNYFTLNGMAGRAKSAGPAELKEMKQYTAQLEQIIDDRLYEGKPVSENSLNPSSLKVQVRENIEGELETTLSYGNRQVAITKSDFDYLARNSKQLSAQAGLKSGDVQVASAPGSESKPGETSYTTYAVLGALSIALLAARARMKKKNYRFAN